MTVGWGTSSAGVPALAWSTNGGRSHWLCVSPHAGRPLTRAECLERQDPGERLARSRTRAFVVSLPCLCAWGLTLRFRRRQEPERGTR